MELVNYMPGFWRVDSNGRTAGWIDLAPDGRYEARIAMYVAAHKGNNDRLIGTYDTLNAAQEAIETAQGTLQTPGPA